MWDERFAEVCRRHPDLVAVYESSRGRLGLLLRHTLVPLGVERVEWLAETRAVARPLIAELRGSGFMSGAVVLQWLPIRDVARIVGRWVRRWDGDPARRSELLAVVERRVIDEQFLAARSAHTQTRSEDRSGAPALPADLDDAGLEALTAWYETMAPCWLAIQPVRRRRLVLQTHVWLAEHALDDPMDGPRRAAGELEREGSLARTLERLVPPGEAAMWRPWIDLVRTGLVLALTRPPERRTQTWARGLFMIPYGAPAPGGALRRGPRSVRRAPRAARRAPRAARSRWTAPPSRVKMEA